MALLVKGDEKVDTASCSKLERSGPLPCQEGVSFEVARKLIHISLEPLETSKLEVRTVKHFRPAMDPSLQSNLTACFVMKIL